LIAKAMKSSPDKKPGGHRTKRIGAPNRDRTRVSAVKETPRRSPKGFSCIGIRLRTQSGPPDDDGREPDGGGEVGCELAVAGGDASPILEAAEHALDEIALAIGGLVEG
jgi:hypothetical protein